MQHFEVELRALLKKKQYDSLVKHFNTLAKGELDDAETYTFLNKNYNIKIKNLVSKNKAKITVKKGAEYAQQADETELTIEPHQINNAIQLISSLGFPKHIPSKQRRINYLVNGITISLKHETNWKYHIEVEIIVKNKKEIPQAKKKLRNFLHALHITPMTEEENRTLVNGILKKYNMDLL